MSTEYTAAALEAGKDAYDEYYGNWTQRQCCACAVPVGLDPETNRWVDERNQTICPAREGRPRGHLPG